MTKRIAIDMARLELSQEEYQKKLEKTIIGSEIRTRKEMLERFRVAQAESGPKLAISPLQPAKYLYDDAGQITGYGHLWCFSVYCTWLFYTLAVEYQDDKVVFNRPWLDEPPPGTLPDHFTRHPGAHIQFGTDAPTDSNYRVAFHLCSLEHDGATAAFYLNGNLVAVEHIAGTPPSDLGQYPSFGGSWQTVELSFDCPEPLTPTSIGVMSASGYMEFHKAEIFVE
jgi:hypothetical protein